MPYCDDPYLVSVQRERKRLERLVDDIIWEEGANDPRLVTLLRELRHYRESDEKGVIYEPKF